MTPSLCLITSVIKTPSLPLSYTSTRSVFTHEERYIQTLKTIESVKNKIPGVIICLVECSDLDKDQVAKITSAVDYFLNIFDDTELRSKVYSPSKSMGEGTMTIAALDYINARQIEYNSFYKISGRYWLNDSFSPYDYPIFVKSNEIGHGIPTTLYKLNNDSVDAFHKFLLEKYSDMKNCKGYELIFAEFIMQLPNVMFVPTLGVSGYVSVDNVFYSS